jgi:hypothetical protein
MHFFFFSFFLQLNSRKEGEEIEGGNINDTRKAAIIPSPCLFISSVKK